MLAGLRFHHFGLAAAQPVRAEAMLRQLGYRCGEAVHDPLQDVLLRWCTHETAPAVEIVSPVGEGGPLTRLLAAQPSSFYHLCWETDLGCEATLAAMQAAGLRAVTVREPLPAVLFGGRRVSFHMVQGFGLIELLESAAAA